jgi:hypothetical protein
MESDPAPMATANQASDWKEILRYLVVLLTQRNYVDGKRALPWLGHNLKH